MRKINSRSIHPVKDVTDYVRYIPGAIGRQDIGDAVTTIDNLDGEIDDLMDRLHDLRTEQQRLKQELHNTLFADYSSKAIDDARSARAKFVNEAE